MTAVAALAVPAPLVSAGTAQAVPATTTHVALHPDDDKILEASPPRGGQSVRISGPSSHGTPYSEVRRVFG